MVQHDTREKGTTQTSTTQKTYTVREWEDGFSCFLTPQPKAKPKTDQSYKAVKERNKFFM